MTTSERFYYFGCIDQPGHYMHSSPAPRDIEERREVSHFVHSNPWGYDIDGGLCPKGPEVEGRAIVRHKDGWTALSFWDRSVDRRGKCNSNFLAVGDLTFDQMVELAKRHFPHVVERFSFPIVEVKP